MFKDITGIQFGNWLVLERSGTLYKGKQTGWLCECQCSNKTRKVISGTSLRLGQTNGCRVCKISYNKLRPYEALFNRMHKDNTLWLRTLDFSLSYEDFIEFTKINKCFYCSTGIVWKMYNSGQYGYNLDRKDNDVGYHKDNLVVCCKRCNMGKRDTFTFDEWYGMTAYFRDKRS